ncbi:MAG: heavy-metal-associated domain-containing protein [Winogradskyella sp.]|nr:heavy-metal-associated domain-containing protein [Winogradskyella sp.]
MTTSILEIQNLKCHGCANTIVSQLSKIEGVTRVEVNNTTNEVSFAINDGKLLDVVTKKLAQLGYPVVGEHNNLSQKAKSFVSCAVGRLNN